MSQFKSPAIRMFRIIEGNDATGEIMDDRLFEGTMRDLEHHITGVWNRKYAHMADRGNSIKAYDGERIVFTVLDYDDEEDDE